jgi:hypothetical protein
MDIATKFACGQEAVEAIFRNDKQPQGRQPEDVPEASAQRGTKKKGKKKSQAKRDATDADLVAAAEHKNPRKPPGGANLFDKMLKESCPYHQGPIMHTLEECVMLRCYFHKVGPPAEGGCWGLVLKCYESRTRQHKMLNINALRPLKHYLPKDLMNFGRRP